MQWWLFPVLVVMVIVSRPFCWPRMRKTEAALVRQAIQMYMPPGFCPTCGKKL